MRSLKSEVSNSSLWLWLEWGAKETGHRSEPGQPSEAPLRPRSSSGPRGPDIKSSFLNKKIKIAKTQETFIEQ